MTASPHQRGAVVGRLATVQHVAFFDVDETLITAKSMLDFVHQVPQNLWDKAPEYGHEQHREIADLDSLRRGGASRAEMNRAYHQRYRGIPLVRLQNAGRDWYRAYRTRSNAYVAAGLMALTRHRQAGHGIVLVSGSTDWLLDPLAEDLGVDLLLCTEQLVDARGLLTGEVVRPMIGEAKAAAVTEVMTQLGVPATNCFAYGDHASDADMLRSVGNPVAVGNDPVLARYARTSGWPVLPSSPGPRSVGDECHDMPTHDSV